MEKAEKKHYSCPDLGSLTPRTHEVGTMKKNYDRLAVIHTEKLEARAVVCAKADDTTCGAGPIQS